jgi:hypothetical protein
VELGRDDLLKGLLDLVVNTASPEDQPAEA